MAITFRGIKSAVGFITACVVAGSLVSIPMWIPVYVVYPGLWFLVPLGFGILMVAVCSQRVTS